MSKGFGAPSILMVGPSLMSQGGMASVEKQLIAVLAKEGFKVDFLSTYEDANKLSKLFIALKAYLSFCIHINEYDVVHVHMASRASYERKALFIRHALRRDKKVLIHHHGGEFDVWFDNEINESKKNEIRKLYAEADGVIVLSEEWLDWFDSRGFITDSFHVIHNTVSIPKDACSPHERKDILFMGRLDVRKSPDVLIRAAAKVLHEHADIKLIFAGDGYIDRYEGLSRDLGIAERCEFLGWVRGAAKEELFRRAAVYCLPSKNEGMPMSVLEAMSYGIPTVATPVGGVPRIIESGVNGYIIPVDDEDALSTILSELMESSSLRFKIGKAGRETIESNFSTERNVKMLIQLYEDLMCSNRVKSNAR